MPSKLRCLRQVLGRGQQHRGVAVVAAGVHLARRAGWRGRRCCARSSAARPCRRAGRRRASLRAVLDDADDAGRAQPRWIGMPQSVSCLAITSAVRSSWKHSSGWAWMSRRMAAMAAASARMDSIRFMARSPCRTAASRSMAQAVAGDLVSTAGRGGVGGVVASPWLRQVAAHALRRGTRARCVGRGRERRTASPALTTTPAPSLAQFVGQRLRADEGDVVEGAAVAGLARRADEGGARLVGADLHHRVGPRRDDRP